MHRDSETRSLTQDVRATRKTGKMVMTRNEWISVLNKAKALADGKDETCFKMFGYLLDAMNAVPVRQYRCDEEPSEEYEE